MKIDCGKFLKKLPNYPYKIYGRNYNMGTFFAYDRFGNVVQLTDEYVMYRDINIEIIESPPISMSFTVGVA